MTVIDDEKSQLFLSKCWSNEPSDKPSFDEIYEEVREIVQILLSCKTIDINYVGFRYIPHDRYGDELNKTALHITVENNNLDIIQMPLLYQDIELNAVTSYKYKIEKKIKVFVTVSIKLKKKLLYQLLSKMKI